MRLRYNFLSACIPIPATNHVLEKVSTIVLTVLSFHCWINSSGCSKPGLKQERREEV